MAVAIELGNVPIVFKNDFLLHASYDGTAQIKLV